MTFDAYLADLLAALDWRREPYFEALASGELDRETFVAGQVQFRGAVTHFARPMALLAARIDDGAVRAVLAANIWEEHGEGDPTRSHTHTFDALLASLGTGPGPLDPPTLVFNHALTGLCAHGDLRCALAALGMIERLFAEISVFHGGQLVARGWLSPSEIRHYVLHERLDLEHAEGLFSTLRPHWQNSRGPITEGLGLGAHLLLGYYGALVPLP